VWAASASALRQAMWASLRARVLDPRDYDWQGDAPLARPLDDSVDILANGRRIGCGALVQIGDSIGVRVTRLFDNV